MTYDAIDRDVGYKKSNGDRDVVGYKRSNDASDRGRWKHDQ